MGKNSLVKSTTKKKTAGKKKNESPKPKGMPKSTSTSKTPLIKEAAKPYAASGKEKKEKAPSRESLIFKKFDTWQPDQLYVPPAEKKAADFISPPFFAGKNEAETEQLRELLFKKFDFKELPSQPPAEKPAQKPPPEKSESAAPALKPEPIETAEEVGISTDVKKKAPSRESLIFKKFDTWQPDQLYVPPAEKKAAVFTSPPFFTGKNEAETEQLRALLFKKFDFKGLPSQPPAEKPAQKPPPEKSESAAPAPVSEKPSPPVKKAESKPDAMPAEAKGKKKTMMTETTQAPPAVDKPKKKPEEEVIHYQPPTPLKGADPVDRTMKFVIAGFGLLILVLIAVSASNSKSYTIKSANGGIEIWKGSFAPIGEKRFMVLSGMQAPEPLKSRYSQGEAFSLTFDYYLNKADALLDVSGIPDLEGIRQYLKTASSYATSETQQASVNKRLNHIDYMLLIYRADVALGKGTLEGAENAIAHLEQAGSMGLDKNQIEIVKGRMDAARKIVANLKAKTQTGPEAPSPSPVKKQ